MGECFRKFILENIHHQLTLKVVCIKELCDELHKSGVIIISAFDNEYVHRTISFLSSVTPAKVIALVVSPLVYQIEGGYQTKLLRCMSDEEMEQKLRVLPYSVWRKNLHLYFAQTCKHTVVLLHGCFLRFCGENCGRLYRAVCPGNVSAVNGVSFRERVT